MGRDFPALVRPGEKGWIDRLFFGIEHHDGWFDHNLEDVFMRDEDGAWPIHLTAAQFAEAKNEYLERERRRREASTFSLMDRGPLDLGLAREPSFAVNDVQLFAEQWIDTLYDVGGEALFDWESDPDFTTVVLTEKKWLPCANDPTSYSLPAPHLCPTNRAVRCDGCNGNQTRTVAIS